MSTKPQPGPTPAAARSAQEGIPGDAVAWVLKRLRAAAVSPRAKSRGLSKEDVHGLAELMRGMKAEDVTDALQNWQKRTGLAMRLDHVHLLLGYLRDFGCQLVLEATNAACDQAPALNHHVGTPKYLESRLQQLANDPARREARAGGHPVCAACRVTHVYPPETLCSVCKFKAEQQAAAGGQS